MKIIEQFIEYKEQDLLQIKNAYYVGDYGIRIIFSDTHAPLVDFKPFLQNSKNPTIRKYLNEAIFKQFVIKDGNLDWNDFDLCFSLEDLYYNKILKPSSQIA